MQDDLAVLAEFLGSYVRFDRPGNKGQGPQRISSSIQACFSVCLVYQPRKLLVWNITFQPADRVLQAAPRSFEVHTHHLQLYSSLSARRASASNRLGC